MQLLLQSCFWDSSCCLSNANKHNFIPWMLCVHQVIVRHQEPNDLYGGMWKCWCRSVWMNHCGDKLLASVLQRLMKFFFFPQKILEGTRPFFRDIYTPVLDLWCYLPWVSRSGWIPDWCAVWTCNQWITQIHPWYNTCQQYCGQYGSPAFWTRILQTCPQALVVLEPTTEVPQHNAPNHSATPAGRNLNGHQSVFNIFHILPK